VGKQRFERVERRADVDRARIDLDSPCLDFGEVQDIVDQREKLFLAPLNALQVVALELGHRTAHSHLDQLRVSADGVERCSKLVRHRGEKSIFA
jgi:hypothetical protein